MTRPRSIRTTVFKGGPILTMDASHAQPAVVVVRDGRVAAVGEAALANAYPDADVVQLGGRVLCPGFIDAHNHLCIAAMHPRWRDAADAQTLDALLGEVRAQAADEPDADWVRVVGWDQSRYGVSLTRHDLDRLDLGRPVVVVSSTLHMAVVDSAGLEALGIGRTTPDPAGGEIRRDPDGTPSGVLVERAWSEAHRRSMAGYEEPERWAELIARRARALLAHGVTAVHDAACPPAAESIYRSLAAAGRLPLSVLVLPHPAAILTHDFGGRLDGAPTGEGDEVLRVGPAKLFADGGVAIAVDGTVGGHPLRFGLTMDDLADVGRRAADRGWRLAVHAIGNVGVERALDLCADLTRRRPGVEHRFRVEHAMLASAEQCRRMAGLGAVGVVQPGFVEHVGQQVHTMRFDGLRWLPFADLAAAGVPLAASSDDPCAPVPPLWGAAKGVSRRTDSGIDFDLGQSVPVLEWLRAYTAGAAYAGGQEAERGSLTPGKRADLVLLDGSLDAPAELRVAETWVAGERVYARGAAPPD